MKEAAFVSLVRRAIEEPPADYLLVVRLAYYLEKLTCFKDPAIRVASKYLLLCLTTISGRYNVIKVLLNKGVSLEDIVTFDCMQV